MKKRVLICTSILQVINTKAAIKKIEKIENTKFKDYILIIHPLLSPANVKFIKKLAKELNYTGVIDFTNIAKNDFQKLKWDIKNNIFKGNIFKFLRNNFVTYYKIQSKILSIVEKKIGKVDAIFYRGGLRGNFNKIDEFFITSIKTANKFYAIEDGTGNYLPSWYTHNSWHQQKSLWKSSTYWVLATLLSSIATLNFYKSYKMYFTTNIAKTLIFRNIKQSNAIVVKKEFFEVLNFVAKKRKFKTNARVIVLGTLLDPRWGFTPNDEIKIYNRLFDYLVKKNKIKINQIYFKSHPRSNKKTHEYYKKKLRCNIFKLNENDFGELEFLNKKLICVVSLGSTGLLYAKKLFGIDSFIIDVRHYKSHPLMSKISYNTYIKNGIKKINI